MAQERVGGGGFSLLLHPLHLAPAPPTACVDAPGPYMQSRHPRTLGQRLRLRKVHRRPRMLGQCPRLCTLGQHRSLSTGLTPHAPCTLG